MRFVLIDALFLSGSVTIACIPTGYLDPYCIHFLPSDQAISWHSVLEQPSQQPPQEDLVVLVLQLRRLQPQLLVDLELLLLQLQQLRPLEDLELLRPLQLQPLVRGRF